MDKANNIMGSLQRLYRLKTTKARRHIRRSWGLWAGRLKKNTAIWNCEWELGSVCFRLATCCTPSSQLTQGVIRFKRGI